MDNNSKITEEEELVESEQPYQHTKQRWEYQARQNPRWGVVTREGLVIGRGDKKKVIPPDEVFFLATLGCTTREIATWYGVPEETLKYNFYDYINKAREETKQKLRNAQLKAALGGNVSMLIWLGKNMLGQSDNPSTADVDKILPWTD